MIDIGFDEFQVHGQVERLRTFVDNEITAKLGAQALEPWALEDAHYDVKNAVEEVDVQTTLHYEPDAYNGYRAIDIRQASGNEIVVDHAADFHNGIVVHGFEYFKRPDSPDGSTLNVAADVWTDAKGKPMLPNDWANTGVKVSRIAPDGSSRTKVFKPGGPMGARVLEAADKRAASILTEVNPVTNAKITVRDSKENERRNFAGHRKVAEVTDVDPDRLARFQAEQKAKRIL